MCVSGLLKHTVDPHQPKNFLIFLKIVTKILSHERMYTIPDANFFQAREMIVGTKNNEKDSCKKTPFHPEKPGAGYPVPPF